MNFPDRHTMAGALQLMREGRLDPAGLPPTRPDTCGAVIFTDDTPGLPGHLQHFPAALKANIARQGWPTTCSSALLAGYRSPFTASAVRRLEAAGARFVLSTAMDEFGMGSSCEYAVTGPVANPWAKGRTPGGSSGGAAAVVAGGTAWYALGSDTGGSVRLPAAYCGLVGFKPTWGRVSRLGLVAFASSLDTVGVLARCVADAALVMQAMAGHDPGDATSLSSPVPSFPGPAPVRGKGLRVGIPRDLLECDMAPGVRRCWEAARQEMLAAGLEFREVRWPLAAQGVTMYQILAAAEAASNLARFDGSFYGRRVEEPVPGGLAFQDSLQATRTAGFGPEVKRRILWGAHVLAEGYREDLYLRARALRHNLGRQMLAGFEQVDVVALPTAPETAFPLGQRPDDPVAMHGSDVFTVPASLAGLPALSLPAGVDEAGLPVGLQLVGPPLGEDVLVRVAGLLEARIQFSAEQEVPWCRP